MIDSRKVRSFEDLWIWQQARILVQEIYEDIRTSEGRNDYGFRDQIQRAGISVMNNIAEGFESGTNTNLAKHLDIARGSIGEVRSMYYLAEDLAYVDKIIGEERKAHCRQISAGLTSLISYLRKHRLELQKTRRSTESDEPRVEELIVPYEEYGVPKS